MTKYNAWMLGGLVATLALAAVTGLRQDRKNREALLVFGDTQPAKVRFGKVGHRETWTGDDSREYSLRSTSIRVEEHPEDWISPTDAQFDEWIASDSKDLQEWLKASQ